MYVVTKYHGDGKCSEPVAVYRNRAYMETDYPGVQEYWDAYTEGENPQFVFVELEEEQ